MKPSLLLLFGLLQGAEAFSAAALRVAAPRTLTVASRASPSSIAILPDGPSVDAIFLMSDFEPYQVPESMAAIHLLMIATVFATFIASSEIARTFKVQSGIFHMDHARQQRRQRLWMAGASLPSFEELAEGCYVIAQDAAETG